MKNYETLVLTTLVLVLSSQLTLALDNGLALTPPMGWLAWERYVCELNCELYPDECINQRLFEEMANRLVEDGYKQLGYQYVNIDDCWSTREREPSTNQLLPDPERFPNMTALAEHVHSLGLRLGIYGDCGTRTCQNFPGQLKSSNNSEGNYFELDAASFGSWQIDSFKFDGCYMEVTEASALCAPMGLALNKTNRPMLFSCSWPAYEYDAKLPTDWQLVADKCNLWRSFGDIEDSWKSVLDTIDLFVKEQDTVVRYHGPGHWFDADQLVVGDFGLSLDQQRAQMAIWAVWASPLYMSNDLRNLPKESARILKNKWVIAVNQDRLGIFGMMVASTRDVQVFVKPLEPIIHSCPSYAIVYLDRRTLGNGRQQSFKLLSVIREIHRKLAKLPQWAHWSNCPNRTDASYNVYDLFDNFATIQSNLNLATDTLTLRTNPSGVRMVQLIQDK